MKKCVDCKIEKEVPEFPMRNHGRWVNSFCKKCMSIRMKKWREKNRKKYAKYQTKYRIRNQDRINRYKREWRLNKKHG